MKIEIPHYFLGYLNDKIPVYCDVKGTIETGHFVPVYSTKRIVKNHEEVINNPHKFFNTIHSGLFPYIIKTFKLPENTMLGFTDHNGQLLMVGKGQIKSVRCPSLFCGNLIIPLNKSVLTCPHCETKFLSE